MTLPNINYSQNESINESINESVNESINDLGLGILRIIKENPGINAPSITSLLSKKDHSITLFRVKNEIGLDVLPRASPWESGHGNDGCVPKDVLHHLWPARPVRPRLMF